MAIAIAAVGSSAPRPDGIPHECYSRVPMATAILKEVAAEIYTKGLQADILAAFNCSTLLCLPKKMDYLHPVYGEVYKCESTRPLSALAFRICLHDYLETWISKAQQGLLNGRAMFRNMLEMDYLSKIYSIREEKAAMILFDFKAAFHSVCQEYVWLSLDALGFLQHGYKLFGSSTRTIVSLLGVAQHLLSGVHGYSSRMPSFPAYLCAGRGPFASQAAQHSRRQWGGASLRRRHGGHPQDHRYYAGGHGCLQAVFLFTAGSQLPEDHGHSSILPGSAGHGG